MQENPESERCGVIAIIRKMDDDSRPSPDKPDRFPDRFHRPDRFLVIRRSQSVTAPGTYCFPGGGVEPGETDEVALPRELNEELSIENPRLIQKVWHSRSRSGVLLAWWIVEIDEAHERLVPDPAEVAEVHWWTAEEMRATGKLLDSNEAFLQRWEKGEFK